MARLGGYQRVSWSGLYDVSVTIRLSVNGGAYSDISTEANTILAVGHAEVADETEAVFAVNTYDFFVDSGIYSAGDTLTFRVVGSSKTLERGPFVVTERGAFSSGGGLMNGVLNGLCVS
jgi:hypothetical protein